MKRERLPWDPLNWRVLLDDMTIPEVAELLHAIIDELDGRGLHREAAELARAARQVEVTRSPA